MNPKPAQTGRRTFLKTLGLAAPCLVSGLRPAAADPSAAAVNPSPEPAPARPARPRELEADLVIAGGGLGGCAAALAAARHGLRVILTEETGWIGGQLTQQAIPPDENRWIESFGAGRSYQSLRTGIRDYYRRNYPLTARARQDAHLNPGNSWVSRIGGEPRVGLAVLYEMLAPYLGNGRVRLLLNYQARDAATQGDRVEAIRVQSLESGHDLILRAPWFADATEQGDLLPLTGTEFMIGAESRRQTTEPDAKETPEPDNLQGFVFCFAMDYLAHENHVQDPPRDYAFWRDFQLGAPGPDACRLLSFDGHDSRKIGFDPEARTGFWSYRRIADRDLFQPGFYRGDVTLVNWPQNDYSFGRICGVPPATVREQLDRARQQSLSLFHWLQTEAPRPDGGAGWPGLRLRPDIVGTEDGLAKYPYIREGRRIQAEFTVLEQHLVTALRMQETGLPRDRVRARPCPDSVGIGAYRMDLHRTTTGDHGQYGSTLPFQIPLGALIPRRVENLLPACKNAGVTHLTNGCFRLHPVEWGVGEAAGALAAFCQQQHCLPRQVGRAAGRRAAFQAMLRGDGVRLEWPEGIEPI